MGFPVSADSEVVRELLGVAPRERLRAVSLLGNGDSVIGGAGCIFDLSPIPGISDHSFAFSAEYHSATSAVALDENAPFLTYSAISSTQREKAAPLSANHWVA